MSELTKQERIIAYKAAMLVMGKLPTDTMIRNAAGASVSVDAEMIERIRSRSGHILINLMADASDLWDES